MPLEQEPHMATGATEAVTKASKPLGSQGILGARVLVEELANTTEKTRCRFSCHDLKVRRSGSLGKPVKEHRKIQLCHVHPEALMTMDKGPSGTTGTGTRAPKIGSYKSATWSVGIIGCVLPQRPKTDGVDLPFLGVSPSCEQLRMSAPTPPKQTSTVLACSAQTRD